MIILQICNKVPYPPKDGGSIATFNLSKAFAEAGHLVYLLCMNTQKHYTDILGLKLPHSNIILIGVDVNTEIKTVPLLKNFLLSKKPYNAERFISVEFEKQLTKLITTIKFDVVQLEGLYLTPYIPLIRKYSNALIALRSHNIEHEIWLRHAGNQKNVLKKFYLNNLAKRIKSYKKNIINVYDVIIPITERDSLYYQNFGNTKPLFVSPTGIDNKNINPFTDSISPDLFHLGALDWIPNQEGICWFIDNCWPEIQKIFPNLSFYIAGRNAPDWFVKYLKKTGIFFCGEIDDACIFMQNHSIMVAPLFSGSGMRIKIIEGMAKGKTIITTSIGTEGINSTHNKNILIANTKDDFVNTTITILKDKDLRYSIGTNAIEFVKENFDINVIGKALMQFYEQQLSIKN